MSLMLGEQQRARDCRNDSEYQRDEEIARYALARAAMIVSLVRQGHGSNLNTGLYPVPLPDRTFAINATAKLADFAGNHLDANQRLLPELSATAVDVRQIPNLKPWSDCVSPIRRSGHDHQEPACRAGGRLARGHLCNGTNHGQRPREERPPLSGRAEDRRAPPHG